VTLSAIRKTRRKLCLLNLFCKRKILYVFRVGGRARGREGRPDCFGDTSVVDSVRIAVNLALKKFRLDEVNALSALF
jgi:hypothetical protein